jgi:hypothetical protein
MERSDVRMVSNPTENISYCDGIGYNEEHGETEASNTIHSVSVSTSKLLSLPSLAVP